MIGDPFDWQLLSINNGRDWLDTLDTACGKRTNHGELYESCYITGESGSTVRSRKVLLPVRAFWVIKLLRVN